MLKDPKWLIILKCYCCILVSRFGDTVILIKSKNAQLPNSLEKLAAFLFRLDFVSCMMSKPTSCDSAT